MLGIVSLFRRLTISSGDASGSGDSPLGFFFHCSVEYVLVIAKCSSSLKQARSTSNRTPVVFKTIFNCSHARIKDAINRMLPCLKCTVYYTSTVTLANLCFKRPCFERPWNKLVEKQKTACEVFNWLHFLVQCSCRFLTDLYAIRVACVFNNYSLMLMEVVKTPFRIRSFLNQRCATKQWLDSSNCSVSIRHKTVNSVSKSNWREKKVQQH